MDTSVLTNLASALRAYLAQQFASGSDQALAFEPFGIPIDPNSFRSGPQGNFNPVLVGEHLTRLTDKVGQLAVGQFHRRWVASQLVGVLTGSTVQDPNALAAFGAVKGPAEQAYRGASPTFPTKAMPDDWYDLSVVGNWTTGQSITSEQQPPPAPVPGHPRPLGWPGGIESPPIRTGPGRLLPQASVVGMAAITADTIPVADSQTAPVSSSDAQPAPDQWELRLAAPADQPTLAALGQPGAMLMLTPASATVDTPPAQAPALAPQLVQPAIAAIASSTSMATLSVDQFSPISDVLMTATPANGTPAPSSTSATVMRPVSEIMLDPDVMVAVLANLDTNATPHPVTATTLTLSFDLCPVSIDRDWWSWLMVRTPGWGLPLWSAGQLVPGLAAEGAPAPPPCGLPSTMLVIKNLTISGWSSDDLGALPQAVSLGPFSFAGGKVITSGSVTAPGMQVVGWVCDLLPPLPPVTFATTP